jgi:hypothetical protein
MGRCIEQQGEVEIPYDVIYISQCAEAEAIESRWWVWKHFPPRNINKFVYIWRLLRFNELTRLFFSLMHVHVFSCMSNTCCYKRILFKERFYVTKFCLSFSDSDSDHSLYTSPTPFQNYIIAICYREVYYINISLIWLSSNWSFHPAHMHWSLSVWVCAVTCSHRLHYGLFFNHIY